VLLSSILCRPIQRQRSVEDIGGGLLYWNICHWLAASIASNERHPVLHQRT